MLQNRGIMQCEFCGKLFNSNGTKLCGVCSNQLDCDFIQAREYLYEHANVSFGELLEKVDISEKSVRYLLKAGKISLVDAAGAGVRCAACGREITTGKLCEKCAISIREQINPPLDHSAQMDIGQRKKGINPLHY